MESRIEKTIEKHNKGYNCAQAVACTYCDLVDLDELTAFKLTEGFGFGMGSMDGTCGAISGACFLAGMMRSSGNLEKPDSKGFTYKLSKQIITSFKERNSVTACHDLKGIDTGKVIRSCPDCIRDAAEFVEKYMFEESEK